MQASTDDGLMNTGRRPAFAALTAAGLLWGTTVPASRLALEWLAPAWLTFARFGLAAAILLACGVRTRLRAACTPAVLAWGAVGYGGSVIVQNAGIARTSVSHAAMLVGATPVLVAIIAACWQHRVARPVAWAGFAVSLAGVGLIAAGPGGGATVSGDGLVLASLLLSATFTVAQGRLLHGRDPVAVTAAQFLAAAVATVPVALVTEGMPAAPSGSGAVAATIGLATAGTLLPFTLFAYGQSRVSAEVAGAFLNLEPLVGAVAGVVVFSDPAGPLQILGGAAVLAGIALSSLPLLAAGRPGRQADQDREPPGPRGRQDHISLGSRRRRAGLAAGRRRLPGQGEPVADRQQHELDPVVGRRVIIKVPDALHAGILVGHVDHLAAVKRVVHQDDPAWPDPRHDLVPVPDVARLVGVDEGQVERWPGRQRAQGVQRRADAQLDPVRDPGLLPVSPCDRRPLLADVAAEQPPAVGQAAGQADRRVAGEGTDLDGVGDTGDPGQQGHEGALLRADLHDGRGREPPGCLIRELTEHRIGRGTVGEQVGMQLRAEFPGSARHALTLADRQSLAR